MNHDPLQYPFDVSVPTILIPHPFQLIHGCVSWEERNKICISNAFETVHACSYHTNTSNTDHIGVCCHSILYLSFKTPARSKSRMSKGRKTSSFLGHPQTSALHSFNYYNSIVGLRTTSAHDWLCSASRLILDDVIRLPQSDSIELLEYSVRLPIERKMLHFCDMLVLNWWIFGWKAICEKIEVVSDRHGILHYHLASFSRHWFVCAGHLRRFRYAWSFRSCRNGFPAERTITLFKLMRIGICAKV